MGEYRIADMVVIDLLFFVVLSLLSCLPVAQCFHNWFYVYDRNRCISYELSTTFPRFLERAH